MGAGATDPEQLRLAIDSIRDYAIFLLDRDGHIRTWNEGARRLKGYEPEEIIGRHFSTFYTEPDLERDYPAHELAVAAREGRFEDEGWRVRKDGSRFWANVIITAVRDHSGELIGFSKVTRDLTERRSAEERLRRTATELAAANRELGQLRLAVSTVRDYAIFLLDAEGHVMTWNEGARRIKGYEPGEIIGEHFSRFYTQPDLDRDFPAHELWIAARAGRFEDEGWRVRKDGSRFWANVVITALRKDDDELLGFVKVTRDLTARREAEERLRSTAAELERSNAELDRFAAAAAHDLVQPLHTIINLADLVRRREGGRLEPTSVEALTYAQEAALHLGARVDALLRYARSTREELDAQPVAVKNALDHVVAALRASLDERDAVLECDDDLGVVRADPSLLELVLQNLLGNALKFHDGRPHIRVASELDDEGRRVSVTDDGIGISPSEQKKIFQLFSRGHGGGEYGGAGMGLPLCRQIIERHGGRIGVDSEPGRGSTFWFTLPAG